MGLPVFTNLDAYYADESQWGDYQYTYLSEVVNDFMANEVTPDSYVANVPRWRVANFARKAFQEIYFDVANEVISVEFDLNPQLTIALPHDFIQYVMISWVDERGKLHPMAIDNSNNLAQAYLQDNDYNFLYDDNGDILQGSHIQNTPANNQTTGGIESPDLILAQRYGSKPYNTDRSKIFKNGSYKIDKERGVIQFSSEVDGRTIVLDYISDGLYQRTDDQIKIHKFAAEAANNYIYWRLVRRKRNVPNNEGETARRDWFNQFRIAKRRIKPIRYEEIKQVLKGNSKWIKD